MNELNLDQAVGLLLTAQAKGAALLLLVAGAALTMRRSSAASRHWVWLLGALGLLALPLLSVTGPRWRVNVPALPGIAVLADAPPVLGDAVEAPSSAKRPAWPEAGTFGERADAPAAFERPHYDSGRLSSDRASFFGAPTPAGILLLAWSGGAGLLLLSLASSLFGVTRLGLRSRTFGSARVQELTEQMRQQLGIVTEVRVLRGESGAMPMSWGLLRPTILLPEGAERWPNGRLVSVLLHELAHVRRRDCLSQVLAEIALALHWLNPLAWVAVRRLRIEREHACDDVVLAAGARPSDYAEELISLAKGFQPASRTGRAAVAMARPSHLATRIRALFQERSREQSFPKAAALAAVAGQLVTGLAAVAPAPRAAEDPGGADMLEPPARRELVVPADRMDTARTPVFSAPLDLVSAELPAAQVSSCGMSPDGWQRTTHNSNDEDHRLEWSKPGCDVEVRFEGEVEFSADFRDVASLGLGALLRIEETEGRTERRLDITPAADGAPSYRYQVDGQEQPFEAAARAWYEGMLLQVFRRGGFMAEERVAALLRSGGTAAVLHELEAIPSDFVFALYTGELFEQGDVTAAQAVTLLDRATARIESDFYMAEILGEVARRHLGSDVVLDAFVAASTTLESDHYRAQVLTQALEQTTLTPPRVAAVLRSAGEIESDHYLAQLLEGVAARYALEPALRESYLTAVQSIESDHYQAEVLSTLLARNDLDADELAVVIRAVEGVESDHYRASVLQEIAARALPSDALRSAYLQAAAGIESDHYRTEALSRLLAQATLSATQLQDLIRAAAGVESDHYKADLLVSIARRHRIEGATRDVFMQAMDSVESQHYRGQVAEALLRSDRGA
jgi:beta-lactamase regulating signal transducer with metallopeptidase domain